MNGIKIRIEFDDDVPEDVREKVIECLKANIQTYEQVEVNGAPYRIGALVRA